MRYSLSFFYVVLLLLITGCSNKVPLGGTVIFSDDGTPLTRGVVFFQSKELVAQGAIKPDGTFRVGTDTLTDGLPRGTYKVYISGAEQVEFVPYQMGPEQAMRQNVTPLIDPKYSNQETSDLTFVVDGRTRKFDIKVDRANLTGK